jgi:archaemetzincin
MSPRPSPTRVLRPCVPGCLPLATLACVLLTAPALAVEPASAPTHSNRRIVAIVPLGKVDARTLARVAEAVRGAYDVDTRIEPARPLPKEAFYEPRKRWRAERLLRAVEADFPPGAWKAVLVTDAEISTTKEHIDDWGIGGLGIIGGRTCVVSTHILRRHSPTARKLGERLRKLAVHELGHTLGLDHCGVFACVMADARGKLIRSLDASTETFCGRCRKIVARNN